MKRTIYKNRFLVDQLMINNTENSKIEEIIKRQAILGDYGIIDGLRVTPYTQDLTRIQISQGTAVLPTGRILSLPNPVFNLRLSDQTSEVYNLVMFFFQENTSETRLTETEVEVDTIDNPIGVIDVLTVDEYLALPFSNEDPSVRAQNSSLIIGIVQARGVGIPLISSSILQPEANIDPQEFSDIYSGENVEVSNNEFLSIPQASASDTVHRRFLGSKLPNSSNPHGISLNEVIKFFDEIPGSLIYAEGYKETVSQALFPKLQINSSPFNEYTLAAETSHFNLGLEGVTPLRAYLNRDGGFSITLNAEYRDGKWYKDNTQFLSTPSIRVLLDTSAFSVQMNSSEVTEFEDNEWTNKLLNGVSYNFLRESLAILPRDRNRVLVSALNALVNVVSDGDAPNKVIFYEDLNSYNGGLRVMLGYNLEDGLSPVSVDFSLNAKPIMGSSLWTKDISANSYLFRYIFENSSLDSKIHQGNSTFDDSEWEKQVISIPGGLDIPLAGTQSLFVGSYTVRDIRYQSERSKTKIVPLGDIGCSLNIPFDVSLPTNTQFKANLSTAVALFQINQGQRINIENVNKNGQRTNSPRYVWRGPDIDIYRSSTEGGGGDDTTAFPVVKSAGNGQIMKFTFPFQFEEQSITIQSMHLPWDWLEPVYTFQDFNFNSGFGPANFFNISLHRIDLSTDFNEELSVNQVGNNVVRWEGVNGGSSSTTEQVLNIRNSDNSPLITISKDEFSDTQALQLEIETNNFPIDNEISYPRFVPLAIGNLIINYTTLYIE